ncbi:alpha/beta-hydrolase [Macrolepiota fuliginosa MF-IS2]|uniref:Alpha/beta-hydrolase n=1 Tax=Macrolepiota fuliginosa MF-IS2 TaxID=1400762 RepID=A0A9P5XEE9_9AGAR|nr:alpha/beta-hydrolase [Macrolepiota fuliginosa MF-IS2]
MVPAPLRLRDNSIYVFLLQFGILFSYISHSHAFDPYKYQRRTVQCDATRRAHPVEQSHIELSYIDVNDASSDTILMVHGWPSVWSTWSKQIEAFENDDYRLLIPDLRGFGHSSHPEDFKSSHTIPDLVHDLVCILDNARVSSAICVGHDWGSQICYTAARMRPDIFTAVVGLVVPYIPSSGPYISVKQLVPVFPKLAYQAFFDRNTEEATKELDRDIRRTLRATLRTDASPPPDAFLTSGTSFLDAWKEVDEIPPIPFMSEKEEDYLVKAFGRQGFLYTLGFYTEENRQQSHAFDHDQGNFTLPQPVLSILPTKDPVADWKEAMKLLNSADFIPDITVKYVEGAHWVHLENPEPVNQAIKDWLQTLRSPSSEARAVDEL